MFRNRGIAFKIGFSVLTGVVWIFFLAVATNYWFSRRMILTNLERSAENMTRSIVEHIDTILTPIQKMIETSAAWLEHGEISESVIYSILQDKVRNNDEIYGCAIAFEPYAFEPTRLYFSPYVCRYQDRLKRINIGSAEYHYFYADWYAIARELHKTIWTDPYFDEGAGNILMTTCATPFYRSDGEIRSIKGVATADISLEWLQQIVQEIRVLKSGYGFLVTRNGVFLTHPHPQWVMNETLFSIEGPEGQALKEAGRHMVAGESGWLPFQDPVTGADGFLYYAPVQTTGWSLGVFFPGREAMADITRLSAVVLFLGVAGLVFLGFVVWMIAGSITRPLRRLTEAVRTISTGNLDLSLPEPTAMDEVGVLSESVSRMQTSLKEYIHHLTETTAAKERIESELHIAREIQMGILPKSFPGPPECPRFCLYATLIPAKEVGGDLYDFFYLDGDHFCFVIGDVSGKGVPASLFMAITRTLIKTRSAAGIAPGQVLSLVNRDLAADNPSMMFVTLFIGILNLNDGRLAYANAGHNPPYRILETGCDIEPLPCDTACPLGIMEDMEFTSQQTILQSGQTLFVYTDGVTDALDEQDRFFGEAQLEEVLRSHGEAHPQKLVETVLSRVQTYEGAAPQFDDITLLALRFFGKDGGVCE